MLGGGRIMLNEKERVVSIFGYSYGFGRADHELTKEIVGRDVRYADYDVRWSNDGY